MSSPFLQAAPPPATEPPATPSPPSPSATAAELAWQWRRPVSAAAAARAATATAARRKGLLGGAVGLAVATGLYFWRPGAAALVASIALAMTALALTSPLGGFRRVIGLLEAFGRGLGLTLTWVLMTLTYALLFLPVGLFLRTTGRLRLRKQLEPRLPTYWRAVPQRPRQLDDYRRQF